MKKIAALTTALTVSMTMLGTIPASAKSVKVPQTNMQEMAI